MKKYLIAVLLCFVLIEASVFAFEAEDLKTYPSATPGGSFVINAGIGIGPAIYGDITVPPLGITVDYNMPIEGLPFFVGGLFEFAASKWEQSYATLKYTDKYGFLSLGGRFGYHLNWAVDKLDTYAVATLGYTVYFYEQDLSGNWGGSKPTKNDSVGTFLFDINLGARYFFVPKVGAFLEIGGGYHNLSSVSLGVACKL
jgi:hypothetical protein